MASAAVIAAAAELGRQVDPGDVVAEEALVGQQPGEGALRGQGEQPPDRVLEVERGRRAGWRSRAAPAAAEEAGGDEAAAGKRRVMRR